ncbi:MAG: leucine-rich repeat domain-containing protein, partial [Oscillospiraceae bacterium]|nr:leucine-rich repeat domain-containing protein [Oscillospiraceae bacterium]
KKGVKVIGIHAFCECNIENLTISESVTEIGNRAFQGCGKLQSVTIPESVKKIGSDAFNDTPWRERLGALVVINHCLLN